MNGSHGHWRTHAAQRKKWRLDAFMMAIAKKPSLPLKECRLTCIRYSSSPMDYDNLVASFKSIVDGIVDARVIIDDNSTCITERYYKWEKAKQGKIRIILEEIP